MIDALRSEPASTGRTPRGADDLGQRVSLAPGVVAAEETVGFDGVLERGELVCSESGASRR